MKLILLALGLIALTLFPMLQSYSQTDSTSACGIQITQLENQIEYVFSPKVVHFIEINTTAFKSLSQQYKMYWLDTTFDWNTDISKCSAQLQNSTVSYELSNSTKPSMGVAHITVDPAMTKILNVKVDVTNTVR